MHLLFRPAVRSDGPGRRGFLACLFVCSLTTNYTKQCCGRLAETPVYVIAVRERASRIQDFEIGFRIGFGSSGRDSDPPTSRPRPAPPRLSPSVSRFRGPSLPRSPGLPVSRFPSQALLRLSGNPTGRQADGQAQRWTDRRIQSKVGGMGWSE